MGSFSKTVTPGFRMGYILTKDHALLKAINTAKEAADLHTNVFAQYVILDYLEHNDLDEHLVKIRNLYRDQARAMTDAMAECFPAEVSFTKPEGGMFCGQRCPRASTPWTCSRRPSSATSPSCLASPSMLSRVLAPPCA